MNTIFATPDMYTGISNPSADRRAAIYCRLSKDDEGEGESSSIGTQRAMLEHYCAQQGFEVVAVYQDDGYTGLNMNRPDLARMLKAIELGQIDVVVTKDAYVKLRIKILFKFYDSYNTIDRTSHYVV